MEKPKSRGERKRRKKMTASQPELEKKILSRTSISTVTGMEDSFIQGNLKEGNFEILK